jgi:uncharacterized protein YozE (UPF0346 family)
VNYRLTVEIRDVSENDVTDLAQQIFDEHGAEFDADRGDFEVRVSRVEGSGSFDTGWCAQ